MNKSSYDQIGLENHSGETNNDSNAPLKLGEQRVRGSDRARGEDGSATVDGISATRREDLKTDDLGHRGGVTNPPAPPTVEALDSLLEAIAPGDDEDAGNDTDGVGLASAPDDRAYPEGLENQNAFGAEPTDDGASVPPVASETPSGPEAAPERGSAAATPVAELKSRHVSHLHTGKRPRKRKSVHPELVCNTPFFSGQFVTDSASSSKCGLNAGPALDYLALYRFSAKVAVIVGILVESEMLTFDAISRPNGRTVFIFADELEQEGFKSHVPIKFTLVKINGVDVQWPGPPAKNASDTPVAA